MWQFIIPASGPIPNAVCLPQAHYRQSLVQLGMLAVDIDILSLARNDRKKIKIKIQKKDRTEGEPPPSVRQRIKMMQQKITRSCEWSTPLRSFPSQVKNNKVSRG